MSALEGDTLNSGADTDRGGVMIMNVKECLNY